MYHIYIDLSQWNATDGEIGLWAYGEPWKSGPNDQEAWDDQRKFCPGVKTWQILGTVRSGQSIGGWANPLALGNSFLIEGISGIP